MTDTSTNTAAPNQFTLRARPGAPHEFDQWRAAVAPVFEIVPLSEAERAAFAMETAGYFFPGMAISQTTSSGCTFERTRAVIARSGIQTILVQVYLKGGYLLDAEGTRADIKPGDIVVFDMLRECTIAAQPYTNIAVTFERELLSPLIVGMDRLHGVILRDGEPRNTFLKSHLQIVLAAAAQIGLAEQTAVVRGTAALVAACVAPSLEGRDGSTSGEAMTTLHLIRRAIDSRLDDKHLGPNELAKQFGLSRASIYRLFEPLGGVRSYIQQRRLMHAYQLISNPSHFDESIASIAAKLGFGESTAFSRAFRNLYRMTPSDVRAAAKTGFQSAPENAASGDASFNMVKRWLLGLNTNV